MDENKLNECLKKLKIRPRTKTFTNTGTACIYASTKKQMEDWHSKFSTQDQYRVVECWDYACYHLEVTELPPCVLRNKKTHKYVSKLNQLYGDTIESRFVKYAIHFDSRSDAEAFSSNFIKADFRSLYEVIEVKEYEKQ